MYDNSCTNAQGGRIIFHFTAENFVLRTAWVRMVGAISERLGYFIVGQTDHFIRQITFVAGNMSHAKKTQQSTTKEQLCRVLSFCTRVLLQTRANFLEHNI